MATSSITNLMSTATSQNAVRSLTKRSYTLRSENSTRSSTTLTSLHSKPFEQLPSGTSLGDPLLGVSSRPSVAFAVGSDLAHIVAQDRRSAGKSLVIQAQW